MNPRSRLFARPVVAVFLLGLTFGVFGETLLWLRAQAVFAQARLKEDFRVVVYMREDADAVRRTVAAEKLRALAGVQSMRWVSSDEGLKLYAREDPDLLRAAAFLGENPLPDAAELELSEEGLRGVPELVRRACEIPETGDILYKPLELESLLRVRFYERLTSLALAFAAGLWLFVLAFRLASVVFAGARPAWDWEAAFNAGAGCVFGALAVALALWPAQRNAAAVAWPGGAAQCAGLLLCAAVGGALARGPGRQAPSGHASARGAALACLLLLACAASVRAQGAKARRKDLELMKERIESKKEEARELQRRRERTQKEISSILDEKQRVQRSYLRIAQQRREAAELAQRMHERIGVLRFAREIDRSLLAQDLRGYMLALGRAEPSFGRAELWREALLRRAWLRRAGLLGGLRGAEGRTSLQRERARGEERVLRTKAEQERGRVEEKDRAYQDRQEALRETLRRAAALQKEVAELEESARALASLISDVERKRRSGGSARAPIAPHSLPWPVEGRVLEHFGKTQVPGLGTWTFHNGIRIEAPPGASVRAVSGGKVLFAGPFRSYGNVLIVDHDEGFYGIYGHLENMSARVGARVAAGADMASCAGREGSVYFEIRQGQSPVDPLTVLKARSASRD